MFIYGKNFSLEQEESIQTFVSDYCFTILQLFENLFYRLVFNKVNFS